MPRNNHDPMRWVQSDSEGRGSLPASRIWSRNQKKDLVSLVGLHGMGGACGHLGRGVGSEIWR